MTTPLGIGNSSFSTSGIPFLFNNNGSFLIACSNTNGTALSNLVYNSVNMTQIGSTIANTATGRNFQLWGLLAPTQGSNTMTASGGAGILNTYIGVASITGDVNQTTPTNAVNSSNTTTTTPSVSITTTLNNALVIGGLIAPSLSSYGSNTNQIVAVSGAAVYLANYSPLVSPPTTVTMSANNGSSQNCTWIGVAINAVPSNNATFLLKMI